MADEPYSHAEGYYSSTGNLYPVIGKVDNCIVKVTPMLNSTYQVRFEFPFSIEVS